MTQLKDEECQVYLDDCFTPKDLPFSPCFAIILKQIRLPSDGKELEIVTEK